VIATLHLERYTRHVQQRLRMIIVLVIRSDNFALFLMLISLLAQFEFSVVVVKVSMNFSADDYRLQEKKLSHGFAEYSCFRKFWRILLDSGENSGESLILEIYFNVGVTSFKSNFNSSALNFLSFFFLN